MGAGTKSVRANSAFFESLEQRLLLTGDLAIDSITPLGPAGHPFDVLEIQFNRPVQDGTFDAADMTLSGPGGPITPPQPTEVAPDRYRLDLASLTGSGAYRLGIGPQVLGDNGLAMDQDGNGTPGERRV